MSAQSFGEVRALLHGHAEKQDVWRALLGIWQKLAGPEHASMRTQMAHYVRESLERDPTWSTCERHAPRAWTNPRVDGTPREFDALYNALDLPLTHTSISELDAHLTHLDLTEDAITRLEVDVLAEDAEKLALLLERFPRVEHLTCVNKDDLSLDLEAWQQMPAPRHLTRLELHHTKLGDYGLEHVLALDWLPQLTHLNLEWNRLRGTHQIAALCDVGFERLESLGLEYCGVGVEGMAMLCDHDSMRHLKELDLNLNGLRGECGEFLAQAVFAQGLERLDIGFNSLSDAGIMQLCTHHFPSLRVLQLDSNDLSAIALRQLAGAPFTPQLEHLCFSFSKGIDARDWLALYGRLERLVHIDVSFCELPQRVIEGLASLYRGQVIESIQLANVHPSCEPQALIELVDAIDPRHLRELSLSDNRLEDEHVLGWERTFPQLTELYLENNALSTRGLAHVLSLLPDNRLQLVSMGDVRHQDLKSSRAMRDELARQQINQLELNMAGPGSESCVLSWIEACAPSLEYLTLRSRGILSKAFYRALGELDLVQLRSMRCEDITHEYLSSFEALTSTKLIESPTLETLSWRRPESHEQSHITRPAGASPWLDVID